MQEKKDVFLPPHSVPQKPQDPYSLPLMSRSRGEEEWEGKGDIVEGQKRATDQEGVDGHVQVVGGAGEDEGGSGQEEGMEVRETGGGGGKGVTEELEEEELLGTVLGRGVGVGGGEGEEVEDVMKGGAPGEPGLVTMGSEGQEEVGKEGIVQYGAKGEGLEAEEPVEEGEEEGRIIGKG